MTQINQRGNLTVFLEQADNETFFTVPTRVRIYDCVQGKAFEAYFTPDRSLGTTGFEISSDGIRLGDPCYRGVESVLFHLEASQNVLRIFKPASVPEPRWSSINLVSQPLPAAAEEYVELLRTMMQSAELLILMPAIDSDFDTCLRNWPSHGVTFQIELLRNPKFASFTGSRDYLGVNVAEAEWQGVDPFSLSGFLAMQLYSGGIYGGLHPDHQRARALAKAVRQSLWADNYDNIFGAQTGTPWSDWFCHVVDQTFIARDDSKRTIVCLICSDTD